MEKHRLLKYNKEVIRKIIQNNNQILINQP